MAWRSALLVALALAVGSCGGGEDEEAPKTTASSSETRVVDARVDGRIITGHCSGKESEQPAVVLESGADGDQNQLVALEQALAKETVVCAYSRAGLGGSEDPPKRPRSTADVVADLDGFMAATKVDPPYLLVGHSAGATYVYLYAQAYPEKVAGFVSMNPVPPYRTWIREARKVETKQELEELELSFYRGETGEPTDFRDTERMLTDPIPPDIPYVVMFDEDCEGDTGFCRRILPPLTRVTASLAKVGDGGRFVRAKGAGHNIYGTDPPLVLKTIAEVREAG